MIQILKDFIFLGRGYMYSLTQLKKFNNLTIVQNFLDLPIKRPDISQDSMVSNVCLYNMNSKSHKAV